MPTVLQKCTYLTGIDVHRIEDACCKRPHPEYKDREPGPGGTDLYEQEEDAGKQEVDGQGSTAA